MHLLPVLLLTFWNMCRRSEVCNLFLWEHVSSHHALLFVGALHAGALHAGALHQRCGARIGASVNFCILPEQHKRSQVHPRVQEPCVSAFFADCPPP